MDDIWKLILYAAAVGVYYLIRNGKQLLGGNPPSSEGKPFMSPAARPHGKPRTTPLTDQPTRLPVTDPRSDQRPQPMLEDKVRQIGRKSAPAPQPFEQEVYTEDYSEEAILPDDTGSLEGTRFDRPNYDAKLPQYRNEAAEVDYEVPEKAGYKGLQEGDQDRFGAFAKKQDTPNRYAELLKNPESARDAFVLGEIFRRKEY